MSAWYVTVYCGADQSRILRTYRLRASSRADVARQLVALGHHGDAFAACEI